MFSTEELLFSIQIAAKSGLRSTTIKSGGVSNMDYLEFYDFLDYD